MYLGVLLGVLFLFPNVAYPTNVDAKELIKMTNEQRKANNLPPLVYNELLTKAAINKANDLLKDDYFKHNSPDGKDFSDWVRDVGYDYVHTGENLAMDFITNDGVFEGWMNSGKHKENILNTNYKEIGIGVVTGVFNGRRTAMVAQIFGTEAEKQVSSSEDSYLAVNNAFLLPRFLGTNTYDIFIPKTSTKTLVRHNNVKGFSVLNSGHLKQYESFKNTYWGEVDGLEFQFKKVRITLLGGENKKLVFFP